MGIISLRGLTITILVFTGYFTVIAQQVNGVVTDKETGEPLFGASVIIKGTTTGMQTDFEGEFDFDAGQEPPFTLEISYLGYEKKEIGLNADNIKRKIKIQLQSSSINVEGVEVVDTRLTQKLQESPLTVESMGLAAIKQTASADFYSGLGALKGVDLTTASMGFTIINTRGFNSTRPVRSLQLVDGADNQAPGLNFSLGNFAGSSELDIQKVDLIVGASSALYGPGAFNGVINMTTKNPFYHPGLSVMVKGAERSLFESAVRYARVIKNKHDVDKFAFKINFHYMRANDWEATNMQPATDSQVGRNNPGGYDAVNRYGDENQNEETNNFESPYGLRIYPGLDIFHRTGYEEKALVDYNVRNLKAGASLHYKVNRDIELVAAYNFGTGTTVYQGDNRYSLKGLKFHQLRLELSQPDKFFIRAYTTMENAGDTYDAVFTAFKLQDQVKSNGDWSKDYTTYWISNIRNKVKNLPGFPPESRLWFGETRDSIYNQAEMVLNEYQDSLVAWHQQAREYADGIGNPNAGNEARLEPGTEEFQKEFDRITQNTYLTDSATGEVTRGTLFYDKSKLFHVQGEYKFEPEFMDIILGANYRMYLPNSNGTIFSDTAGTTIRNWEYGLYGSLEKKVFYDRLILTLSGRMDKNQNFKYLFSPAASVVYSQNNQTVRLSFSSALRNPTLQDQYLYYDLGRAILIGNINGVDSLVTVESLENYIASSFNYDTLDFFNVPPVRPERVQSIEVGIRNTLFKKLYLDASFYYSWYKDFLGYKIGVTPPSRDPSLPSNLQAYRISANSPDRVETYGFSIGLNYYFYKTLMFAGNYSWNVLDRKGSDDPIIPAFNTPEHKFNIGVSGKDIVWKMGSKRIKNIGFNINYKWVEGFEFEGSPQFTGHVPTYSLLDAQLSYTHKKIYTTFKLGSSNVLNNKQYQTYGGPFIGRMIYFSVTLDMSHL